MVFTKSKNHITNTTFIHVIIAESKKYIYIKSSVSQCRPVFVKKYFYNLILDLIALKTTFNYNNTREQIGPYNNLGQE